MSQPWAKQFYHSPAWRHNRHRYLDATLDTSGNVLSVGYRDGEPVYCTKDGREVHVNSVVPPGVCERCFALGKLTPATMVHHIRHLTPENIGDPKVSLAYDNLMRLCQDCHAFMHSDHSGRRCEFNEDGTIKPVETSLMEQVMMLTQTEDERRNFHRRTDG